MAPERRNRLSRACKEGMEAIIVASEEPKSYTKDQFRLMDLPIG